MRANGTLVAGGSFARADNLLSVNIASLISTCPATAVPFGSGCTGSGGANTLNTTSLPWTGSTFGAVATGMPANAIAVAAYGLGSGSTPLQSILPQGVPGCSLLVSPDLLLLHLPPSGAVATSLTTRTTSCSQARCCTNRWCRSNSTSRAISSRSPARTRSP